MLVLADRGFDAGSFATELAGTGAKFLVPPDRRAPRGGDHTCPNLETGAQHPTRTPQQQPNRPITASPTAPNDTSQTDPNMII
jgi:hypothetical protein